MKPGPGNSSGYLLAKTDTFKGKQVITYTEKNVVLQQQINITKADHGKVETYKIGRTSENDKVTERDQGKDVDIKVLPDEGYYLKDIQIVSDTDQTIRWYDDENYSLGFTMPEGNVTITPVFEKIDASYKTIPENSMYRQVYGYNGGRDGNRYYIPVEIKGINTSYDEGQKPEYTVKAADGTALTEGTDYTVNETVKETSDGILHTLTFEGIGGYSYDDGGYLKAKTNIFRGSQVITYTLPVKSPRYAQPITNLEIKRSKGQITQNTYSDNDIVKTIQDNEERNEENNEEDNE